MSTMRKRTLVCSAAVCLGLVLWGAQTNGQQQAPLVIQGGTLIDGMGGAPVANSVVVIQGNRIVAAGRAGQAQIPAGAQIINANGKFVLPGLWDSQTNYAWFWGELMLNEGVTSTIDIGDGEEQSIAYRDAANHGKVVGPRALVGIGHMGGIRGGTTLTGMETPLATRKDPKSAEDAKTIADRFLAAGADMVMFHDGSYPSEFYQAAYDEAHKAGKPAFCRCGGPKTGPKEGALAGADVYPHSTGIGAAVAKDGTRSNNELDRYAAMDDTKAKDLIEVLVAHHVNLVPTIVHDSPGYPKDWTRYQAETEKVFSDPNLLAYYEPHYLTTMQQTYARAARADQGDARMRRQQGYLNMLRFNKMYDAAGGRVLAGGDTNQGKAPGLILHDEMEAMQEAGIPRMHIIQGATEWPAEAMRVQNTIGSLTPGRIADVLIVNADPLQDIANLRNIDTLILDGKTVERGFHASFSTPFRGAADVDEKVSVVDRLAWTTALKQATFRPGQGGGGGNGQAAAPQGPDPTESPQPAIESITPVMVAQGSATVTLTVKGFNFVRRSRVYFDDESVPYKRISATELQVVLDANLLARAGRFDVVVKNPERVSQPEWGNGTSNKAHLLVTFRN
jgi:hypothetical protein